MAILENPYLAAKPLDPMFSVGRAVRIVQAKISLTAETADNDVVILAKGLPATARVHRIMLPKGSKAFTGASIDIGLYRTSDNSVIDEDALADGQSLATALGNVDIVGANIANFDAVKDLVTLAGLDNGNIPAGGFSIGAKIVAKGTVTGDVDLDIYIEQD